MLNILINAYACSPNSGSEPGMAWNWCTQLAKHCELNIITEEEFRDKIEAALPLLPQGKNMNFYFNPVPEEVRKMCWNQGDWRFYYYYRKWQKRTFEIAQEIIVRNKIDIIHQLNMIGFREPGYLWKIKDIPFIWGPIGGMLAVDKQYLKGAGWKTYVFNVIKQFINKLQLNCGYRIRKAIHRADFLISGTPDFYKALKKYHNLESTIIPETGCFLQDTINIDTKQRFSSNEFNILWVGRMIFTKRLDLALYSIANVKDLVGLKLHICGDGSPALVSSYKKLIKDLGIENNIIWHGSTSHQEVQQLMLNSQLFLFTSVKDATSTVILEAMTNYLPVLCFDISGMGYVINDSVGRKVQITNPEQSIVDFSNYIRHFYNSREDLQTMSANCKKRCELFSWESKATIVLEAYNRIINNYHD